MRIHTGIFDGEAKSRTPMEIALRIVSVAKSGEDRNDSLVLIVGAGS